MITMQKAKIPSHVTMHSTPSLYRLGAKEVSPPKKKTQGSPPTVFTGSTIHNVAQNLTNCKKNMLHYTLSISLSAIKSLTVWRAVSSPGGSGHQRIDIGFVRHYLAALPPRAGQGTAVWIQGSQRHWKSLVSERYRTGRVRELPYGYRVGSVTKNI